MLPLSVRRPVLWLPLLLLTAGVLVAERPELTLKDRDAASSATGPLLGQSRLREFVETYCLDCHDRATNEGKLHFEELLDVDIATHPDTWEKVVRKLTARQMPPAESQRPDEGTYDAIVASLESSLDAAAAAKPEPGRTPTFRRLNRTEYQNAVRDLLAMDVDVTDWLPPDESSHGFDNISVTELSPTLLNRYIAAANKISQIAAGAAGHPAEGKTFRLRPDITQDVHIEGLPLGTRGGAVVPYNFPRSGEYEIQVRLMRDRNEGIEGLTEVHDLEILLDRERLELFEVKPAGKGKDGQYSDANLKVRRFVSAGPHDVAATFVKQSSSLLETMRQPLNVHFNFYRHPRLGPAVYEIEIVGPLGEAATGDSPSRRRIFVAQPKSAEDEPECAKTILSALLRRAYRRPVNDSDLSTPLKFFEEGRAKGGFDSGIEAALSAILVNPQFLFRIERDPQGTPPHTPYRVDDFDLASRLSFFLWSSIPDEELLELAESARLSEPSVLRHQVQRMLADERSRSLIANFASQWLYLRNLDAATPDMRLFPDFDDNLRQAMREETELFLADIWRSDRSVLDLLDADYTFLNERLARHYGIPNVSGSHFRKVTLDDASHRGGLLRQASILTVTSYATRTSPVLRGQWVLKNILGCPPPPPPANVPALDEANTGQTVRERLAQHRANAACAGCHNLMDPVGFALEGYDAIGRWREAEGENPVDDSGGLPGGSEFAGVSGLEQAILARKELFVRTLVEKLMTFALGRGIEPSDAPSVRKIVRDAAGRNYTFASLVAGIADSVPFQMRMSP